MIMMLMIVVTMVMVVIVVAAADRADLLLRQQIRRQGIALLHGREELAAGELVPGSGDNGSRSILLPEDGHRLLQLLLRHLLGAAEDDGPGILHLVGVKLAEVLHIGLALAGIGHGDGAAQHHLRLPGNHILDSPDHVRQLAYAGGLNEDPVGMELLHHLLEGLAEIPHQGAADAPGVHLGDLHPGVLQEAAVDTDLAELVFNEDDLFPLQGLVQELLDESSLSGPQKAGNHVYFCHVDTPLSMIWGTADRSLLSVAIIHRFSQNAMVSRSFPGKSV